ncbi:MAG: hypothetical protein V1736_01100 [Pseudomonadota bacterium]
MMKESTVAIATGQYGEDYYRLPDKAFGCVIGRGCATGTIPSLLPSQRHYLKVYNLLGAGVG